MVMERPILQSIVPRAEHGILSIRLPATLGLIALGLLRMYLLLLIMIVTERATLRFSAQAKTPDTESTALTARSFPINCPTLTRRLRKCRQDRVKAFNIFRN